MKHKTTPAVQYTRARELEQEFMALGRPTQPLARQPAIPKLPPSRDWPTMKYKTAELEFELLDAAVAKAVGIELLNAGWSWQSPKKGWQTDYRGEPYHWSPSSDWNVGMPMLVERRIYLLPWKREDGRIVWSAEIGENDSRFLHEVAGPDNGMGSVVMHSPLPLFAGMRRLVYEAFGEEVELP